MDTINQKGDAAQEAHIKTYLGDCVRIIEKLELAQIMRVSDELVKVREREEAGCSYSA